MRTWRGLSWEYDLSPAEADEVAELEEELGLRFPAVFREFLSAAPGLVPEPSELAVPARDGKSIRTCVGEFVGVDNLRDYLELEGLPDRVIPFAMDPGGDLICFDYRRESPEPPVVYWHHELEGDESVTALCDSFEAFLKMLK